MKHIETSVLVLQCDREMETREIKRNVGRPTYFDTVSQDISTDEDDGNREMGDLYPFLICGGQNTERYYFTHINDITEHKFNIRPKYFGDESNYIEAFPKRIREILSHNKDAKIFCVFDWDTVSENKTRREKHKEFEEEFKGEISCGVVSLCPSMPCIEYWFLLHFEDNHALMKTYSAVARHLSKYIKSCYPDPAHPMKKLLKETKYLSDVSWVRNLCSDGKLDLAIERAERNIMSAIESDSLDEHSYSFVYKVFK